MARFEDAQETAIAQLGELYDKAMEDVGEANAAIFEVHQMMLMDLDYVDSIKNIITTQEVNAEYAVATTGDNFSQMFASMDDAYMQGRAADVKDVSDRLLGILSDAGESGVVADEPVIVAADDLVPSETVQLDKSSACICNHVRISKFPYGNPCKDHEHPGRYWSGRRACKRI